MSWFFQPLEAAGAVLNAVTSNVKTVNLIVLASVKTLNGVAKSAVKKINNVDNQ